MQNYGPVSTSFGPSLLPVVGLHVDLDPDTIEYSPHLLLDASSLDRGIVMHPEYSRACACGFDCFLGELYVIDEHTQQEVLCLPSYTLPQVTAALLNDFAKTVAGLPRCADTIDTTDGWTIGFYVGWLSGLALYQPVEARAGLLVLAGITSSEYGNTLLQKLRQQKC